MKYLFLILSIVGFCCGCSRTAKLITTDAQTSQPVSGARITVDQTAYDLIWGEKRVPIQNMVTDSRGLAIIRDLRDNRTARVVISKEGYQTNYCAYSGGKLVIGERIEAVNDIFILGGQLTELDCTNGAFSIRLSKEVKGGK